MPSSSGDAQATFCATLVDEWIRRGVRRAVVAPGSRSTPIALAVAGRLHVEVVHDERVAGFVGLGLGLGGVPAVVVCTSGTAAANLLPAVVEAGLSAVPMLVVTADRPPELRDVGAAQTIDQTHLFGRSVRWFHDPGVADHATSACWRSLARRAFDATADGPVHLNLPFRDPLIGLPGPLPRARPLDPLPQAAAKASGDVTPRDLGARGVILAGGRSGVEPEVIVELAARTGWPILADPTSGVRHVDHAVGAFDALLRHPGFAATRSPDVIVRIGRPAASKVLGQWVAAAADGRATLIQVGGPAVIDPDHQVAVTMAGDALDPRGWGGGASSPWLDGWLTAGRRAEQAIDAVLRDQPALTEPAVARTVARHLPAGAALVVASSMPVRDLEWFGGPAARAQANRGANGIDGVLSTALGVSLRGATTVALVGDLAFLHDGGALTALAGRGTDLRIVVVDNDGGGIFSFLPQAGVLADDRFEQLFGTPHGADLVALAHAHHLDAVTVTEPDELAGRLVQPGPTVTRVPTDRRANVRLHDELNATVAAALDAV
ncbi:MAG: 2-succinyl-5-enolpyruvyl-6-hydroxy-3-cyclohexene-1-carboxylic-acid synthase [Ilumatobacteraceae bacterium]